MAIPAQNEVFHLNRFVMEDASELEAFIRWNWSLDFLRFVDEFFLGGFLCIFSGFKFFLDVLRKFGQKVSKLCRISPKLRKDVRAIRKQKQRDKKVDIAIVDHPKNGSCSAPMSPFTYLYTSQKVQFSTLEGIIRVGSLFRVNFSRKSSIISSPYPSFLDYLLDRERSILLEIRLL